MSISLGARTRLLVIAASVEIPIDDIVPIHFGRHNVQRNRAAANPVTTQFDPDGGSGSRFCSGAFGFV